MSDNKATTVQTICRLLLRELRTGQRFTQAAVAENDN
jgi:hypothetical protein